MPEARQAGHDAAQRLAQTLYDLGIEALSGGRPASASHALDAALNLGSRIPKLRYNLALALSRSGQSDLAADVFSQAQSDGPRDREGDGFSLRNMYACEGLSLRDYQRAAEDWSAHHASARTSPNPRPVQSGSKPLRVGLLSGRFHRHAVGFLTLSALEQVQSNQTQLHFFSNSRESDDYTERFKNIAATWHDIAELDDDAAATLIAQENLDLLIDMGGHSAGGRPGVILQRPAPVQAKWVGGQHGATGFPTMDYFISDSVETLTTHEEFFHESVVRLPASYACYTPPPDAPEVNALPAFERGYITFGCFNNIAKITPATLGVWSTILSDVAGSKLLLKHAALDEAETRDRLRAEFAAYSVHTDQLTLMAPTDHGTHLKAYSEIDVSLDPFPWNGCVTTCESLWMGVPVLTLPGEAFCHRHSASFLTSAGLEDWIATDRDDYVERAHLAAKDLSKLSALRKGLRPHLAESPLCDSLKFGADLELLMRSIVRSDQAYV